MDIAIGNNVFHSTEIRYVQVNVEELQSKLKSGEEELAKLTERLAAVESEKTSKLKEAQEAAEKRQKELTEEGEKKVKEVIEERDSKVKESSEQLSKLQEVRGGIL